MKAHHLLVQILLSVALLVTASAPGQIKTAEVPTPPEINLVPLPSRIVVFQDFESIPQFVRQKKEALVSDCADSLLSVFGRTMINLLPSVECLVVPIAKDDSLETPFALLRRYRADLAFGIADFRPEVVQGEVTTTKNDDNSKSKRAKYSMTASGTLRIYNSSALLKTFPFSESEFLQDRAVMSGLFAAGPSLVKNKEAALEVADQAAQHLAEKFVSRQTAFTITLFKKKELKEVTDLIEHDNYKEALPKVLPLTTHENEAISSRACYLCAFLYHMQMDFAKAFEYAERARKIKKIITAEQWNTYYYFLKRYAVDNEVVWKQR